MPDTNQLTWVYYRSGRHSKEASEELAGFLIGRARPLRANHNTAEDKRIIVQYNIHRSNPSEIPDHGFCTADQEILTRIAERQRKVQ